MIIKEIHIDGFGIFSNFSLTNLRQGINIISGNNETGKSTLLEFLRYTLFGYPGAIDKRRSPQMGGNHGGRIKSILSTGEEVIFERFSGSSGGSINLIYEGKSSENQNQWLQLLGNATAEIFKNIYAFSLIELADLTYLSASGVEDKIFSVSMGLGNISIGEIEDNIESQVNNIYKPRGSTQEIPSILKEVQIRNTLIHRIQENLPQYQELTLEIKRLEGEINNIETNLKAYRIESNRLDNYLKCYDSFVSIINFDRELELLPELHEYPEDGITRFKELEREEQELIKKIQELKNGNEEDKGIEELEEEIKSISFNSKLLEKDGKIEYLRKNLEKYKQTITDKSEDDEKIEKLNKSVKQELNNINAKWTEQDITEFSDIITHQNKIKN
jgi:uncharacterized protein YhaN